MKNTSLVALAASLLLGACAKPTCPVPPAAGPGACSPAEPAPLRKDYSDQELLDLISAAGFTHAKVLEPNQILFTMDSSNILLSRFKDGDLQLYYGVRGASCTHEIMNEWNTTRRLSRAYMDEEKDVALESDLFLDTGATPDQIKMFITIFRSSAGLFLNFLLEKCQTNSGPEPGPGGGDQPSMWDHGTN